MLEGLAAYKNVDSIQILLLSAVFFWLLVLCALLLLVLSAVCRQCLLLAAGGEDTVHAAGLRTQDSGLWAHISVSCCSCSHQAAPRAAACCVP